MIELSVSVTGPQIANQLTSDEEELAYFFDEIEEAEWDDMAEAIKEHAPQPGAIAIMLRAMADKIESKEAEET